MILILGFTNKTSFSLAKYLIKNYEIIISDLHSNDHKKSLITELQKQGTVIDELGNQDISLLKKYNISQIFLSPGVPRSIPLIQEAIKKNIEILNDIEFFYRTFPNRKYIAITGTDGKTTVTTWIGNLVQREYSVVLAGNIGNPIFEYAGSEYDNHVFVVELSSFQLESIEQFHPHISVITNISEDHIDRYPSMHEYARAKKNILKNQNINDIAILSYQNNWIDDINDDTSVQKYYFAYEKNADCFYQDNTIWYDDKPFFDTKRMKLSGKHNILNAMTVILVAKSLKISDLNIFLSLEQFSGVPHRLQYVASYQGIDFYNDSKATTAQALSLALESFDNNIILLAGGRSKGIDFFTIKDIIVSKTKKVFLFGELAPELYEAWGKGVICSTMHDAFHQAVQEATSGDHILLSPGGVSFDEYQSYEARGNHFIQMVYDYLEQNSHKNS